MNVYYGCVDSELAIKANRQIGKVGVRWAVPSTTNTGPLCVHEILCTLLNAPLIPEKSNAFLEEDFEIFLNLYFFSR